MWPYNSGMIPQVKSQSWRCALLVLKGLLSFFVLRIMFALLGNNCTRQQSECRFSIVCHLLSVPNSDLSHKVKQVVSCCAKTFLTLPEVKKVEEKRIQWLGGWVCFEGGGVKFGTIRNITRPDVWSKMASILAWKSILTSGLLAF